MGSFVLLSTASTCPCFIPPQSLLMYLFNYLDITFTDKDQIVWFQQIRESSLLWQMIPSIFTRVLQIKCEKFKLRFFSNQQFIIC